MTVNTLGSHEQVRSSRTVAEWLWPFLPMGISAFCLSSLIYYHLFCTFEVRTPPQMLVASIYRIVGLAPSVLFFLLALTWSSIWLAVGKLERPVGRLLRLLAMAVMLGVFLNLGDGGVSTAMHKGQLGAWLAELLVGAFGYMPSLLLVWAVTFASLLLATDFFFSDSFERLRTPSLATEAGVETAVTDHLRGLGSVDADVVLAPGAAVAASLAVGVGPSPAEPTSASGEPMAPPTVIEAPESDFVLPTPPRRRSYSERRREREGGGRASAEEEWLPNAPESQEIDNPESRQEVAWGGRDLAAPVSTGTEANEQAPIAATVQGARGAESGFGAADVIERSEGVVAEEDAAVANEPAASTAAQDGDLEDSDLEDSDDDDDDLEDSDDEDSDDDDDDLEDSDDEDSDLEDGDDEDSDIDGRDVDDVDREVDDDAEGAELAIGEAASPSPDLTAPEQVVSIPRPAIPPVWRQPEQPVTGRVGEPPADRAPAARQQQLFGVDEESLIQDAIEVVTGARRASATLLQRKLRIGYEQAVEVLAELAARGVIALEGDATHGRVLG